MRERWADALVGHRRQPVRLLHPGDRDAAGRPRAGWSDRPSTTAGRPGPAGPSLPLHRMADHRGGRRAWSSTAPTPAPDGRRPRPRPGPPPGPPSKAGCPRRSARASSSAEAGFADDTGPADALVAVPDGTGGYAVAETLGAARALAGKVQGRKHQPGRSTTRSACPPGDWDLTLRTTWVEPAYLEPDASWCAPGGEPASPVGNGGAFGGQAALAGGRRRPPAGRRARSPGAGRLVARGRGAPRAQATAGGRRDHAPTGPASCGSAVPARRVARRRVGRAVGRVAAVAPGLVLEPVPLAGPAVSSDLRAAVWAEAAVLAAAARLAGAPTGRAGRRRARRGDRARPAAGPRPAVGADGSIDGGGGRRARCSTRWCCAPTASAPPTRPWAGCAPRASPWTRPGTVHDLTIRSFGILPARAMPPVTVVVGADGDRPAGQRLRRRVRRGGRRPLAGRRAPAPLARPGASVPDRRRPASRSPQSTPGPR